jgi:hypothetical protein
MMGTACPFSLLDFAIAVLLQNVTQNVTTPSLTLEKVD